MNEKARDIYRRIVGVLKPQLREGSTVRALLLALSAGGSFKLLDPQYFPLAMLVAYLLAAVIPDEIGKGQP